MAYKIKNKQAKERGLYKVLEFEKKHGLTFVGNVEEIFDEENLNKSETKFTIKKLEDDGMNFDKDSKKFLLEQAEWRAKPYRRFGAKPIISTAFGEKKYLKTEVEDENGKWKDNYSTKDGFFVIHDGRRHHIYS